MRFQHDTEGGGHRVPSLTAAFLLWVHCYRLRVRVPLQSIQRTPAAVLPRKTAAVLLAVAMTPWVATKSAQAFVLSLSPMSSGRYKPTQLSSIDITGRYYGGSERQEMLACHSLEQRELATVLNSGSRVANGMKMLGQARGAAVVGSCGCGIRSYSRLEATNRARALGTTSESRSPWLWARNRWPLGATASPKAEPPGDPSSGGVGGDVSGLRPGEETPYIPGRGLRIEGDEDEQEVHVNIFSLWFHFHFFIQGLLRPRCWHHSPISLLTP